MSLLVANVTQAPPIWVKGDVLMLDFIILYQEFPVCLVKNRK